MNIKTAVRNHLRANDSAQKPIDWDEIALRLETDVVAAPARPTGKRRVIAVAAGVLIVALFGLIPFLLLESDDTPPATEPVSPSTTVAPTTTTPATEEDPAEPAPPVVGDDEFVFAMAQSFPLISDPEFSWSNGPDEATGRTAGIHTFGDVEGPGEAENPGGFSVEFMAFDTEDLASAYLEARHDFLDVLEMRPLTGLGDEASVMHVGGDWTYITEHGHALVRRGRFVAETIVVLNGDSASDREALIAKATEVAEIADETMRTVLSSDIQPLPAPPPETLTSYEMNVEVSQDPLPRWVNSIVTPKGYGCEFVQNDEAQPGVAEIDGVAFQQIDWNEGWFPSTPDSPDFRSLKDLCQTWSPQLDETYLGDVIRLQEGHVGIHNGRQTSSYWFTKDDLIEAGVVTASDNVEISDFRVIVDRAGPWLVSLSFDLKGDAEAVRRLVLLDIPDLETTHSFSINVASDVAHGINGDGAETWADRLDAWIQPAS